MSIDLGTRPPPVAGADTAVRPVGGLLRYVALGLYFGLVLTKSEAVSWFRIQEMFRFQSIHMYGILGSGVAVAALSVWLIRVARARSLDGTVIEVAGKPMTPGARRYWMGGTVFGLGWALLGACPGPIYALLGTGVSVLVVSLGAALLGTWTYGALQRRLPH